MNRQHVVALTTSIGTRAALVLGLAIVASDGMMAHHSAAMFDLTQTFALTGTLTKVDWRNPHVEVFVDLNNGAGDRDVWRLETGAPSWFRNRSLPKATLEQAIGQTVMVDGVRAKDGSPFGYLYRLVFADGEVLELR
jgi:hypothetical protein